MGPIEDQRIKYPFGVWEGTGERDGRKIKVVMVVNDDAGIEVVVGPKGAIELGKLLQKKSFKSKDLAQWMARWIGVILSDGVEPLINAFEGFKQQGFEIGWMAANRNVLAALGIDFLGRGLAVSHPADVKTAMGGRFDVNSYDKSGRYMVDESK
jgi:hypothetical protein